MLNKSRMIELYRDAFNVPKGDAEQTLDWFFDTIRDELVGGGEANFRGFGSIKTKRRPARLGTNPRTGQAIRVEARTAVIFKPGRELLAQVQGP